MPRKNEPTERACALTRQVLPVDQLLRFVLDPNGNVIVDVKRTLPGRGVWLTATKETVAEAIKKRAFSRSFKEQVQAQEGLADQTEKILEQAALGALSISRKAGDLITGFTNVEASLRKGNTLALVHASDASQDGVRKLTAIAVSNFGKADVPNSVRIFSSEQLSLALGRANVIHAALLTGQAGRNFLNMAQKLAHFKGVPLGIECSG